MEAQWTIVCRKLTLVGVLVVLVLGVVSSKKEEQKSISLFSRHYDCIPTLLYQKRRVNTTRLPDGGHLDNVTLHFVAFGRPFTVDLSLNRKLFPTSYIEKVFHSPGQSTETRISQPSENNCFYHGRLRYQPESEVAISTCNGFTGYITDRHDTYHLEPWKGPIHRVYRDKDRRKLPFRCGTDSHDSRLQHHADIIHRHKRAIRAPYDSNENTRYVELYLVNDYRTYERHGKNKDVIVQRSQDIANIVSSLYRQLNIYIALVGVEIWAAGDPISITTDADNTMENFLRYRKERINPHHHNDNAHLITGVYFNNGVVGKAIKGPICTHQFSGGVNTDYGGLVTHVATTVAHEMGHNFGMQHDNDTTCECRDDKCIMAATSGQISPRHWSSCSQSALAEAFNMGMDYCLRNVPTFLFDGPICGNGFKEDGEECDCGLPKDCSNRCCNPSTCKLHSLAECGTGRCCNLNTCKVKAASTMCREPRSECDLAEFCNGTSEYCPPDVSIRNGRPCLNGQSYCYKGECKTHTDQCKLLWGDSGRKSHSICYQQLNMKADGNGSCGYNLTTHRYLRCNKEDVMCGLLQCIHLNEKLMFWKGSFAIARCANFLSRGNRKHTCRSAMLDVGLDMHDPGFVADGTKCEHNKICFNQKCTPLAKFDTKACPLDCNNNGRCNSNGNCHCNVGYAPPFCDQSGPGGSLDSGPASNDHDSTVKPTSTQEGRDVSTGSVRPNISTHTNDTLPSSDGNKDGLLIGLLVVFLLVVPIIILIVLAYLNRHRLWKWWKFMPSVKDRVKKSSYTARLPPRPTLQPTMSQARGAGLPPPYQAEPMAKSFINKSANHSPRISSPGSAAIKPPSRPAFAPKTAGLKAHQSNNRTQGPFLSIPVQETEGPSSSSNNSKSNQTITNVIGHVNDNFPSSTKGVSEADVTDSPKNTRVIKRDSFRGANISYPVLKSTTNRNSVVESLETHVDIIGPEANKPKSPSPNRPKSQAMRRSHSDRTAPHQNPSESSSAFNNRGIPLKKSASAKSPQRHNSERDDFVNVSKVQQDEEWGDNERTYCNETAADDLVSCINKTLGEDSIYRNISNEESTQKPLQETDPPAIPDRTLKYKQSKPNQSVSFDSNQSQNKSPSPAFKSSNEASSGQNAITKRFKKPTALGKSSSSEAKSPQQRPALSGASWTNKNLKEEINQSITPNLSSRPKPSNSFSSAPSRKPGTGQSGKNEIPALSGSPVTKTSSNASVKSDTSKTPAPKAKVSNLAAKFSQNSDRSSTPVREVGVEKEKSTKPSVTDKPAIGAKPGDIKPKPSLAPKPVDQTKKPVPPKPVSSEVKRVRSFKI